MKALMKRAGLSARIACISALIGAIMLAACSCRMVHELKDGAVKMFRGDAGRAVWRLELDIPKDEYEAQTLFDDYGGFHGDGAAAFKLAFSEDASKYFSSWSELPVQGKAEDILIGYADELLIPRSEELAEWAEKFESKLPVSAVEKGKWKLVDRTYEPQEGFEYSNVTLCVFDSEKGVAYILEIDN